MITKQRRKTQPIQVDRIQRCLPRLEVLEDRTVPATISVINTQGSGAGTLAQAILDANASPGLDTIVFNIPGGPQLINITTPLPVVSDPLLIDATTQPGQGTQPLIQLEAGGMLTADAATEIRGHWKLHINGTVTGSADLNVTGTLDWTGGTLAGTGTLQVGNGALLNLNGSSRVLNKPVANAGLATWTTSNITGSGSFTNLSGGTFLFNSVDASQLSFTPQFVNHAGGLYQHTGTSTGSFTSTFQNDGMVQVNNGIFSMNGGGSHQGTFQGTTGTLRFGGGTHTLAVDSIIEHSRVEFSNYAPLTATIEGTYNVATLTTVGGPVAVTFTPTATVMDIGDTLTVTAGGNLQFNSGDVISPTTVNLLGSSTLGGSDMISIPSGGNILFAGANASVTGSGVLEIQAGATTTLQTYFTLSKPVVNRGTANWTTAEISTGAGGSWTNSAGGVFNANASLRSFAAPFSNETGSTVVVNANSSGVAFTGSFSNSGLVNIATGKIKIPSGTSTGQFQGSGTLQLNGHTLAASSSVTVGSVIFGNGASDVYGLFQVTTSTDAGIAPDSYGTINFHPSANVVSLGQSLSIRGGNEGGIWNFNSGEALSVNTLTILGGTLQGSDALSVAGQFSWTSSGILNLATPLTLSAGSTGLVQLSSAHSWNGTISNQGTLTIQNRILGTGSLVNQAGGVVQFQVTTALQNFLPSIVNHAGATVVAQVNSGLEFQLGNVNNQGTLQVATGTVQFNSSNVPQYQYDTLTAGTWRVQSGGTLRFTSGTEIRTNQASIILDGAGSRILSSSSSQNLQSTLNSNAATGSLTIQNGNAFQANAAFTNAGTLTVGTGSSFTKTGIYTQSAASANTIVHGTLTCTSVSLAGGVLQGTGMLMGNVSNSGGVIRPGTSPGILTINGDFTQTTGGTLELEIGGTAETAFDQLHITGTATLGGTLEAELINGYVPTYGNTFAVLQFGSHVGDFGSYVGLAPVLKSQVSDTDITLISTQFALGSMASYATVDMPFGITSSDFNQDGILDLFTAGNGSGNVFRGNGDGSFTQISTTPLGNQALEADSGDLNNDGRMDVVTANFYSDSISVLLGDGQGGFTHSSLAVGPYPNSVALGYLDNDPFLDIVSTNRLAGTIAVMKGNGDGTFNSPVFRTVSNHIGGVTVADINSDGFSDLITVDLTYNTMSILLGNGDATFTLHATYSTGSYPWQIEVGDFNHDNTSDLAVVCHVSDRVDLFQGLGDGSFILTGSVATGSGPHDIRIGDLNDDGTQDLVVSLWYANGWQTALGRGDGTFETPVTVSASTNPRELTLGDFDGNGTVDVAGVAVGANRLDVRMNLGTPANPHLSINVPVTVTVGSPFQVTVTARDSNGNVNTGFNGTVHFASSDRFANLPADYTFTAADQGVKTFTVVPHSGGSQTVSAALVGSNGIVAGKTVNVTLTPASLGTLTSYSTVSSTYGITTGDFNRDGILDLLTSGNTGSADIFRGNGDGTFSKTSSVTTGGRSVEAVSADLNNDGKIDVITADASSNAVSVLLGDGDGGFARTAISTGLWPTSVAVGKLNNDAFLDIVTTNFDAGTISILYGNGNGTFQPHVQRTVSTRNGGVTIADFNGDGFDDIVTAEALNNYVSVLLGNGTGTFPTQVNYSTGSYAWRIETTDFNQDGKKDLAVACYSANRIDLLRGNGDGTFTSAGSVPTGSGPIDVKTTDLNGDGLQDMVVSLEAGASWQAILGRGDGTFDAPVTYAASSGPRELAVGDFDGNGTVDVAGAAYLANRLDVRLNAGSPANPHLAISVPAQVLVGTPTQVTVTALDSSGNINTGFTGTVHFASSDRFANLPADYTFTAADQGVKTFTINLHSNTEQTLSTSLVSNSSIVSGKLIMVNTRPVANIGGTYSVSEGGAVTLDASASNDVDPGQALTLSYTWDLDGDGILGETGVNALHGDETGQYAVFSAASLTGPTTQPITLRVTDSWGSWDEATGVVTIHDLDSAQTPQPDTDGVFYVLQSALSTGVYHDVTADASGNLKFVWDSYVSSANNDDIFLRAFDLYGTAQGNETRVNGNYYTIDSQVYSRIATNGAGRSVVTWQSWGEDVNGWATVGRIIDSNGSPISGHFLINQYGGGWEVHPSVAMRADGSFLAAYRGDGRDGSSGSIMASFFDMYGNRVGDEFLVNEHYSGDQYKPLITLTPSGDFMVAWTSSSQDAGTSGIYARRVNASGAVGSEFRINVLPQGDQYLGDLVTLTDGTVVAAYFGNPDATNGYDVFVRRFTPEGQPLGGELRVNSFATDSQDSPDIIATEDGGFVVAWQSLGQDGSSYGIYAQRFNATGAALGSEFLVNSVTAGAQSYPHLAAHGNLLTVSWLTWTEFGGYGGVVARQFHLDEANGPPTADAGGPYSVVEGNVLTLDASTSSDPENDILTYTWDINGDGTFGDASGVSPTLTWAMLEALGINQGPFSITNLRVRVDDGNGNVVTSSPVVFDIVNTPPVATLTGPTVLVRTQPDTFSLSVSDPSSVDQAAPFFFELDWDGNGVFEDGYTQLAGSTVAHSFITSGTYVVRMRATDQDGGVSQVTTHTVTVSAVLPPSVDGDLRIGGTDGDDLFLFTPGPNPGEVTATLNGVLLGTFLPTGNVQAYGGNGTDTVIVNGTSLANVFALDQDSVTLNTLEHAGFQIEQWTINALGSGDTITVYGGSATINGGSGADHLLAALPTNNHWNLTAQNAGNLNGTVFFTSIEHLTGGDFADVFHLPAGVGVSGDIVGGLGQDTLDYTVFTTPVTVNLQTGAATRTGGIASIEYILGGSNVDTIIAPNTINTWSLSTPSGGDVNEQYYFADFENLTGGNQADLFIFTSGSQVVGNLSGGGGSDTIHYPLGEDITINLETRTATRLTGTFTSIAVFELGYGGNDTIIGEDNTNHWYFAANGDVTVDGVTVRYMENLVGGSGADTVHGPILANIWQLSGANAGTLQGVAWQGMENLAGSSQADTFQMFPGGSLSGTLNGGSGIDLLDYSGYQASIAISLTSASSTGVNHFTSITHFQGSTFTDTFTGLAGTSNWTVTDISTGTVNSYVFQSMENLQGGVGNDTFAIAEGVLLSGTIDGGPGSDKLDYAVYASSITVNLLLGLATGTAGVTNIEHVTGGSGNDRIVGNNSDNTLFGNGGNDVIFGFQGNDTLNGGAGRDLLIGGSGADTVTGGGDEDILIAALLQFANESTGLVETAKVDAVMAEWTRSDLSYAARIAHLNGQTGGGLNGNEYLNSSTILNDGVVNVMEGSGGLDWFLGSLLDQINKANNETLTII